MDEKTLLDEAIAHAEDISCNLGGEGNAECREEHAQLAAWLRELRDIKFPEPLPVPAGNVVSLDEHRIRSETEFLDEQVAYVEALWGKETVAFNAAVRDLEAMRRGQEEPGHPLRPPVTYHEAIHLVLHVRALANDLARHFGLDDQVRSADDDAVGRKA